MESRSRASDGAGGTQMSILGHVLERARAVGHAGVVVFDLDSTLLDNRPRQARILREFGRAYSVQPLTQVQAVQCDAWDLARTMVNCGLGCQDIARLTEVVAGFWRARFFTSEYC